MEKQRGCGEDEARKVGFPLWHGWLRRRCMFGHNFGAASFSQWATGFWLRRPHLLLRCWPVGTWIYLTSSVDVDCGLSPVFPEAVSFLNFVVGGLRIRWDLDVVDWYSFRFNIDDVLETLFYFNLQEILTFWDFKVNFNFIRNFSTN